MRTQSLVGGYEISVEFTLKMEVVYYSVTPSGLVGSCRHFGSVRYLHPQMELSAYDGGVWCFKTPLTPYMQFQR